MQISANGGTIVLDYYPIKGWDNVIQSNKHLRILTFKGETQMNRAIVNKNDWSNSNTNVEYNSFTDCSTVVLHRTAIATYDHNTLALKLNTGGWHSNTTKSRLNAILDQVMYGARVYQKAFDWYLSYNNQTVDFWDGMILVNGDVV